MSENTNEARKTRYLDSGQLKEVEADLQTGQQEIKQWFEPEPLDVVRIPEFPIEVLPKDVGAFAECLAEVTQTPEEMTGIVSLGVLATIFQRNFTVRINSSWSEPLALFCVCVAAPAERKSAVLSAFMKPIREYEQEQRSIRKSEIQNAERKRELIGEKYKRAMKAASANNDIKKQAQLDDKVYALGEQLDECIVPKAFQMLTDDCTQEKLVELMSGNDECMTISSAEGDIFEMMAGLYSKKPNNIIYLKGHSGDSVTVDRKSSDSVALSNPKLTVIEMIQPTILNGFMGTEKFRGNGMCARFLYVIAPSKVGFRKIDVDPIPTEILENYYAFVSNALHSTASGTVFLSDAADKLFLKYREEDESILAPGGDLETMKDWGGKRAGETIRIAALLHCAENWSNPCHEGISEYALEAAIKIMQCLTAHAQNVYMIMGADSVQEDAKYAWKQLTGSKLIEPREVVVYAERSCIAINKRIFQRATKWKNRKQQDSGMNAAINRLVELDYVRIWEHKDTGGRPSDYIVLNPLVCPPD